MTESQDFFSQKHKWLLNIADWAKYLAWISLVVYIFLSVSVIFQKLVFIQQMQGVVGSFGNFEYFWEMVKQDPLYHLFDIGTSMISVLLRGVIYFVVLKAVSLGLTMIVETNINYREKGNSGGVE